MSAEYARHAYTRTILAELQRYLADRYMVLSDAPPIDRLVCEEVFYAEHVVPQDAFHDVLELLQRLENAERQQMQEYRLERRAPLPSLRPEPARGKRKKRKPTDPTGHAHPDEDRGPGSGAR
jgi:hypothetical protein